MGNELEQLLLQKPPQVGPVVLPPAAPGSLDVKTSEFTNALNPFGEQAPGSLPAALGAMAGMFLPGKLFKGMETGVATAPKVAPKRAAQELADLLLGRSKRVPTPTVYQPVSDADASLKAMLLTRTHTLPPPTTQLRIHGADPLLKPMGRYLTREPGITEAYKARQKALGKPATKQDVSIYTGNLERSQPLKPPTAGAEHRKIRAEGLAASKPITSKTGSLHAAGLKPYTVREINSMLKSPVEAFKRGMMTKEQMQQVLETNRAKIAEKNSEFMQKDWELYQKNIENAIAQNRR
jgi:hypothetical protein